MCQFHGFEGHQNGLQSHLKIVHLRKLDDLVHVQNQSSRIWQSSHFNRNSTFAESMLSLYWVFAKTFWGFFSICWVFTESLLRVFTNSLLSLYWVFTESLEPLLRLYSLFPESLLSLLSLFWVLINLYLQNRMNFLRQF